MVFQYHGKYNKRNKVYQVWQQNNRPKVLHSPAFTYQKINYIHQNPVEAGFVNEPKGWKYSSAGDYEGEKGLIDLVFLD